MTNERHERVGRQPRAEWIRFLFGLVAAATVAYFTTISAINTQMAEVKTRQDSNFGELLRRLDIMQADIRELRQKGL